MTSLPLAHGAPAGGAPLEDLIPAVAVGVVLVAGVIALGWAHRTGRTRVLARLSGFAERISGMPGWASLPGAVTGVSLLTAVFGFYWDVGTHIDNGRDAGPFANPAHWFILVGLIGIALAGALAVTLGCDDEDSCPDSAVRLRDGWKVPVGGLLLLLCGVVALAGFPLDDVWHRIFGQDVTLWGPTHIQMVGGASLATLAQWVLFVEGERASPGGRSRRRRLVMARDLALGAAFLIGLSTLQGEFDFGVPQFRLLFQPVMIMLAASIGLVAARIRLGRGGALAAALGFIAIRGALTLVVGPGLDRILLHFPLYLVEAVGVEVVAARIGTGRQLTLGAWSGVAIGTVGLAAEWGWSHLWMPLEWTAALLPEVVLLALPAAVAGGVVGGLIGRALAPRSQRRQATPRWLPAAVAGVIVLALGWPLPTTAPEGLSADISLTEAPGEDRRVHATVELDPAGAADDAEWFTVTAWQGADWTDEQSVVQPLEKVGDGVWRTTSPVPVHGDWKALLRLHRGRVMVAAPIYMPQDEVIGAEEIPARTDVTRDFVAGKQLLQREARDVSSWLWAAGNGAIALIALGWVLALAAGLRRIDHPGRPSPRGAGSGTGPGRGSDAGPEPEPSATLVSR